jgi:GT2 family glycosyltransferase
VAQPDDRARIEALEAEVERLRVDVERQRRLGRQAAHEARALVKELRETQDRLTTARRQMRAFAARRSVKLAVEWSDRARRGWRRLRRPSTTHRAAARPTHAHPIASEADERLFLERAIDPHVPPTEGPLVSIVMLNRDGEQHLRRCLPALAATAYRNLELIAVDNASSDGSVGILETFGPAFPIRVIRNSDNTTFSEGNDQGAAEARGDLLLFLNNDVEPLDPRWLGLMVETAMASGVAAVGARLVYPRRDLPLAGKQFVDLSLQHGGVAFTLADGAALPVPLGAGEDAATSWAMAVREVPALTAACLLVSRAAFEAVGGFSDGYVYGHEDVDLCLKLRDHGVRLMYDGRAALWHHESSTRNLQPSDERRARSSANRDHFVGIWGPRLYRTVIRDAIRQEGFWTREPFRLAVVGETPRLDRDGWDVRAPTPTSTLKADSAHAVLMTDPSSDIHAVPDTAIRVAWIAGPIEPWLANEGIDDLDIIAVEDAAAAEAIRARSRTVAVPQPGPLDATSVTRLIEDWLAATRVGVRIAVPSWEVAQGWGDLHFGRDLQRALERAGYPTRIHLRSRWDSWAAARDDIGIHLLGRGIARKRPGRVDVLWHISHPDAASVENYEAHDLVLVASDSFAAWMATQASIPVLPFHQATDPERFRPGMPGPHHELLFVANSRGVRRHLLDDLLPTDRDLAVYGKSWSPEWLDQRYVAGEHIPNDVVGGYYSSADIVLNDHWPDMQREGFMSNRLYDASAAGAFVITDGVDGVWDEFDGGVVSYETADELRRLIDRFLADPAARSDHAARARAAVLARHTFEHRVLQLFEHIEPLLRARRSFEREEMHGTPIAIAR